MAARRHAALGFGASAALHGAALAAVFAYGNGWWGAALPVVGTAPPSVWPVLWVESENQARAVSEPAPEPAPESTQASAPSQAPPPPTNVQPNPRAEPPKPKIKPEPVAVESVTTTVAAEPAEAAATNAEQKPESTPSDAPEVSSDDGTASDDLALAMALPAAAPPSTLGWSGEVRIPPVYPLTARRRGAQGEVLLRAEIGADGVPTAVTVLRGSGHAELDAAARAAVEKWRFRTSSGFGVEIPIVFRLDAR